MTQFTNLKSKAITELRPEGGFSVEETGEVTYLIPGHNEPSESEIKPVWDRIKVEWTENEYARARQAEYPDWGTQLEKIYDSGIDKWKTEMVDPVKAKWPKDNSGPV